MKAEHEAGKQNLFMCLARAWNINYDTRASLRFDGRDSDVSRYRRHHSA